MSEEAEPEQSYLIAPTGEVIPAKPEDVPALAQAGYVPASEEQGKNYVLQKKYGGVGSGVGAFVEGALQTGTFGISTAVERGLGVPAEDISGREEAHGTLHTLGSLATVAATLIPSGGTSALAEGAARTAPSLIAKVGEHAAELLPEGLGEGAGLAGRLGAKALKGAVSAGTEGALYGASHVVHEMALGDPNLTAQSAMEEVGLSALLGGAVGGGTGVLGGLVKEAAGSELAQKLVDWSNNFEGFQKPQDGSGGLARDRRQSAVS